MKEKLLNDFGSSPRPHRLLPTVLVCTIVTAAVIGIAPQARAADWGQRAPIPIPSGRRGSDMAFISNDKVLLFGGDAWDSGFTDETWIYDLSDGTWTQMSPASKPSPRAEHAMAYVGDDKVILYGGYDSGYNSLADVWVYDLSDDNWTSKSGLASVYSARDNHAMAYIGGDKVLVHGGDSDGFVTLDTWVYDLSENTWTFKMNKSDLRLRQHVMEYVGDDKVMLFGGYDAGASLQGDTWVYDLSANSWTQKYPSGTNPTARSSSATARVSDDQVLLFGGHVSGGDSSATYQYDRSSNSWTRIYPDKKPSGKSFHAMAGNGDGMVLLFGGSCTNCRTWLYPVGINVTPTSGLSTTEAGGTAMFSISATFPPTVDVTIPLSSSDATEGVVLATVTLPAGDTTAVTVIVTGVDDLVVDGPIVYSIATGNPTSGDAAYNTLGAGDVANVSVTNQDDDMSGITVAPTSGLITTEAGVSATFTISADSEPTAAVTIPLSSSDTTEGTVLATVTLPAGSTAAQTVTVAGVNDFIVDGDIGYMIVTGDPTSADANYGAIGDNDVADISVTNQDDDYPGSRGDVNIDGQITLIDVRLCQQIAAGVIVGSPAQREAADVDGDGDVDVDDATILAEFVIGIRATLP